MFVCVVKMLRIYLNFVRGFINKQASPLFLVSIFDGACLLNSFSVASYLSICVRLSVCLLKCHLPQSFTTVRNRVVVFTGWRPCAESAFCFIKSWVVGETFGGGGQMDLPKLSCQDASCQVFASSFQAYVSSLHSACSVGHSKCSCCAELISNCLAVCA